MLLLVVVVTIPLGLFLLLALALLYTLGYVAGAHVLGRQLAKPPSSRFLAFLIGWMILRGIGLIPVLGGLAWVVARTNPQIQELPLAPRGLPSHENPGLPKDRAGGSQDSRASFPLLAPGHVSQHQQMHAGRDARR